MSYARKAASIITDGDKWMGTLDYMQCNECNSQQL